MNTYGQQWAELPTIDLLASALRWFSSRLGRRKLPGKVDHVLLADLEHPLLGQIEVAMDNTIMIKSAAQCIGDIDNTRKSPVKTPVRPLTITPCTITTSILLYIDTNWYG